MAASMRSHKQQTTSLMARDLLPRNKRELIQAGESQGASPTRLRLLEGRGMALAYFCESSVS